MKSENAEKSCGEPTNNPAKEAPLTPEELAYRTRVTLKPDVLHPSRPKNELIISAATQEEPKLRLERRHSGWSLQLPADVTHGLVAQNGRSIRSGDVRQHISVPARGYRTDDTDFLINPPIVGRYRVPAARRKNGRRMRLDGIIFNNDDRVVFDPGNFYPWRCIGKLLIWNDPNAFFWNPPSSTGTAALVGHNFVLTSSHMVPNQDRWKGIFLPGAFDGRLSFDQFSYIETWHRYNPFDQGSDLAILKLYDPIGDQLGWFGSRVYDDDWEDMNVWTKAGYPTMLANGNRPSFTGPFPIIDDDDSYGVELEYRADASGGDSGAPVFANWADGPYIVGAHSGGEEEFEINWPNIFTVLNNVAAGGPALNDLVSWGRTNW